MQNETVIFLKMALNPLWPDSTYTIEILHGIGITGKFNDADRIDFVTREKRRSNIK